MEEQKKARKVTRTGKRAAEPPINGGWERHQQKKRGKKRREKKDRLYCHCTAVVERNDRETRRETDTENHNYRSNVKSNPQ